MIQREVNGQSVQESMSTGASSRRSSLIRRALDRDRQKRPGLPLPSAVRFIGTLIATVKLEPEWSRGASPHAERGTVRAISA